VNPGYRNVKFQAELPKNGLPSAFGIVTACNPNGRKAAEKMNQTATEALRRALTANGLFFFPVTGGSPDFFHAEPGFGVCFRSLGEALEWGQRFHQEAIFWVEEGRVQLVPCNGSAPLALDSWQSLTV
jgi:hypothetical protein